MVSALTQATSRHPSSIRARAYAAASCVLPTPRIPVTARTTTTRPGLSSPASSPARGWNPAGSFGISPTTTGTSPSTATAGTTPASPGTRGSPLGS